MLVLLAAPLLFVAGISIKQKIVQEKMQEKLEKSLLQTVSIRNESIVWVKEGKEILINGKLFDVKSASLTGNHTVFTGLYDEDEDALKEKLNRLALQNKDDNNSSGQSLLDFLFFPVFTQEKNTAITFSWNTLDNKFHCYTELIPEEPSSSLLLPPKL